MKLYPKVLIALTCTLLMFFLDGSSFLSLALASQTPGYTVVIPRQFEGTAGRIQDAVINQAGQVILPLDEYDLINLWNDGFILVISEANGRQGLLDEKGRTLLPYEYYGIVNIDENYITAYNEKGYFLFNRDGETIIPVGDFDFIGYYASENMVDVKKDGLSGYISLPEYIALPDEWARPEVDLAIAAGLVPEDMQRGYQDNITRAEFCRLAVNMIEVKTGMKIDVFMGTRGMSGRVLDPILFTDTTDPAIEAASRLGIVKGVGDNKFNPQGSITRQDAAVMLQRTAFVLDVTTTHGTPVVFADQDKCSDYALEAIDFVSTAADKERGTKVMGGIGNNQFLPKGSYTRQQAYMTILRLYNAF